MTPEHPAVTAILARWARGEALAPLIEAALATERRATRHAAASFLRLLADNYADAGQAETAAVLRRAADEVEVLR